MGGLTVHTIPCTARVSTVIDDRVGPEMIGKSLNNVDTTVEDQLAVADKFSIDDTLSIRREDNCCFLSLWPRNVDERDGANCAEDHNPE